MAYPFTAFTFDSLIEYSRSVMDELPDYRFESTNYQMADAAISAFSMFFFQCPSFLDFQRKMKEEKGCSNAQSLFGIENIMSSAHTRNMLDEVEASEFSKIYSHILEGLYVSEYLEDYRGINNNLYVAIDGVYTVSSDKISCQLCHRAEHKDGTITYSHSILAPAIVAPGNPIVIPLWPEHMKPQDGHKKQDCENTAAKRWLITHGDELREMGVTILGDDLYSRQPLAEAITEAGLNYILVCKRKSHKKLYEWVDTLEKNGVLSSLEISYEKNGHTIVERYRFNNEIRLRADNTLAVNWCEMIIERDGKVTYTNAFVTNHWITEENVVDIARGGRARWKIENENNGTLKTRGYHLEHNFGHGSKNLTATLLTLNILAFLFHTVLDLMDEKYQLIREKLPRKTFFDDIRALTRYICFEDWNSLLDFMMEGLKLKLPKRA